MKKHKVIGRDFEEESKFGASNFVSGVFNSKEEKMGKKNKTQIIIRDSCGGLRGIIQVQLSLSWTAALRTTLGINLVFKLIL